MCLLLEQKKSAPIFIYSQNFFHSIDEGDELQQLFGAKFDGAYNHLLPNLFIYFKVHLFLIENCHIE